MDTSNQLANGSFGIIRKGKCFIQFRIFYFLRNNFDMFTSYD